MYLDCRYFSIILNYTSRLLGVMKHNPSSIVCDENKFSPFSPFGSLNWMYVLSELIHNTLYKEQCNDDNSYSSCSNRHDACITTTCILGRGKNRHGEKSCRQEKFQFIQENIFFLDIIIQMRFS